MATWSAPCSTAIPRTASGTSISSAPAPPLPKSVTTSHSAGCWRNAPPREAEKMSGDFTPEQRRYLEGFVSGLSAARSARSTAPARAEPTGPDAVHIKAQAAGNEPPKPADNFRWRYFGLFYVAPAQDSYMCRLRIPNGILKHWQFAGLADLAEQYGGGYAHVTTRANIQMREIEPKHAVAVIDAIQDL